MALCTIGLSLRFRAPIVIAWSTPGRRAAGRRRCRMWPIRRRSARLSSARCCLTVVGLTGWFDTLMKKIPAGHRLRAAGGHPVRDRHRNFPRRAIPDRAGAGDVLHLSGHQAPRAALCDRDDADRRHGGGRRPRSARLQPLSCRPRAAGADHAGLLGRGDHQHRHSAVRRRDGLAERAGHRRAARRRLYDAVRAADRHHRHRLAAARAVRLARHQSCGDYRGHLYRPRSARGPQQALHRRASGAACFT